MDSTEIGAELRALLWTQNSLFIKNVAHFDIYCVKYVNCWVKYYCDI